MKINEEENRRSPKFNLEISADELRVIVHRLSMEGSFLRSRAELILPDDDKEIADRLANELSHAHDRRKLRE